ncbi:hypothetical protein BDZ89DRAFT_117995 [Hymenopellis radicata]|nr:hypothetical protein BDZ89DRAFT_117995 [Hymenopellis radicata]
MAPANSSVPTSWITKIYVQGNKMGNVLPDDVYDDIQQTWEQLSRQKTTIAYCDDVNECLALAASFQAKHYRTIIGDSMEVVSWLRNDSDAPQIILVPRQSWDATWERREIIDCDCMILVRPLNQVTREALAKLRRKTLRDCKVIQVVDPDEPKVLTLVGWEDNHNQWVRPIPTAPPPQEETTGILSFRKSGELEVAKDREMREKENEQDNMEAMIRNEEKSTDNEKVADISVETPAPEPSALSDFPVQSFEDSPPVVGETVPEQRPRSPATMAGSRGVQDRHERLPQSPRLNQGMSTLPPRSRSILPPPPPTEGIAEPPSITSLSKFWGR